MTAYMMSNRCRCRQSMRHVYLAARRDQDQGQDSIQGLGEWWPAVGRAACGAAASPASSPRSARADCNTSAQVSLPTTTPPPPSPPPACASPSSAASHLSTLSYTSCQCLLLPLSLFSLQGTRCPQHLSRRSPDQPLRHAVVRSGSSGAAGVRYHDGDHVRACTALRCTLIFSIIASASSTTAFAAANCPIGACLTKSNASRHGKQTLLHSCPLH